MGDYLQHFGIKGMKWGVRRTDAELGNKAPNKKRFTQSAPYKAFVKIDSASDRVAKKIGGGNKRRGYARIAAIAGTALLAGALHSYDKNHGGKVRSMVANMFETAGKKAYNTAAQSGNRVLDAAGRVIKTGVRANVWDPRRIGQ